MVDVRKIAIIFVIAVLFTIFTFTALDSIFPSPEYNDYCKPLEKIIQTKEDCREAGGNWTLFDEDRPIKQTQTDVLCTKNSETENEISLTCKNLVTSQLEEGYCDTQTQCREEYEKANDDNKLIWFIIAAIFGLIAIIGGIYLSPESNNLNEWLGTGFMLGGLLNIFVGTIIYFPFTERYVRPVIIFFELVLIIFISYKKLRR